MRRNEANKFGDVLVGLSTCSLYDLDKPLAQLEIVYQEVNSTPRKISFINEQGITDIDRLSDEVIDFVIAMHPHLASKMESIRLQHSIAELIDDIYKVLSANNLDDDFYVTYMFVNPVKNRNRSLKTRCDVCGLNPIDKYGAAGIGVLTGQYDKQTDSVHTVCPTCKTLLRDREQQLSINFLKNMIEED